MGLYYPHNNRLVSEAEFRSLTTGAVGFFAPKNLEDLDFNEPVTPVPFSAASALPKSAAEITGLPTAPLQGTAAFVPIGFGKPLTIEIRHIYTGSFPAPTLFHSSKDVLITSAIKDLLIYDAAPRAVNLIQKDVTANTDISGFAGTEVGTPLIYYSPAVTQSETVLTLEIGFADFPKELVNQIGQALAQVAAIPAFITQSTYLIAAGAIAKIAADLGARLFEAPSVYSASVPLYFDHPGSLDATADYRLVVQDSITPDMLSGLTINSEGVLVDNVGRRYEGDIPYIVISLDGRPQPAYEKFAPAAASAAVLEKFYGVSDNQELPIQPLMDALQLYSDLKFRKQVDGLDKQLSDMDTKDPNYAQKKLARDAAAKNIIEEILKPKA